MEKLTPSQSRSGGLHVSAEALYRVSIEHTTTKHVLSFIGQGTTFEKAMQEGLANLSESGAGTVGVTLADGSRVNMTLRAFEARWKKAAK